MDSRKLISTKIQPEEYTKVMKFLDVFNKRTGKDLSLSKFTYMCIRYFIKEYVRKEKEK